MHFANILKETRALKRNDIMTTEFLSNFIFLEKFQQISMQQFFNNPQHRTLCVVTFSTVCSTRPPSRQYFSTCCLLLWLTLQTYGLKLMPLSLYVSILYLIFSPFIPCHDSIVNAGIHTKKTHNFFWTHSTIPQLFSVHLMSDATWIFFATFSLLLLLAWLLLLNDVFYYLSTFSP